MSGGFFRGTTADQDTRFSNKQAKLLKSQKFAPELEHLVDVSKVKMDVIKPWIAKRVTEFLGGFEDEVLINFIYGLLEGKEINGKAVQIQLTGFMEKNTGKFMKELWALLISAQNNASGVPQQFLDAKEEETKKKKAESDRITSEIQKRKDRETDEEKKRKMDGGLDNSSSEESNRRRERGSDSHSGDDNGVDVRNGFRGRNRSIEPFALSGTDHSNKNNDRSNSSSEESNRRRERGSDSHSGDDNGVDVRNGFRGRNRSPRLPYPSDRPPSPHRGRRSMSVSKSFSNSRSYSKERSISKSISPRPRKYSVSPEIVRRTPPKSVSPRKPIARGSTSPRRRPHSGRSPSPTRRRFHSPLRRRSPSPFRRRSRSPLRHRSPPRRRRSPSPRRRRSPSPRRRRSPPIRQRRRRSTSSPRSRSPVKRRSPYGGGRRYQSPVRRRSPYPGRRVSPSPDRRGSPLPRRHRSPSPRRNRSPSPVRRRSPYAVQRRSPVRVRRRSPTRSPSRSVSPANRSSASPARDSSASPIKMKSPGERARLNDRDHAEPVLVTRRQSMAMSPQRDHSDISRSRRKVPSVSPSPEKSPTYIESPKQKTRSSGDNRRLASSYGSSHKAKTTEDKTIRDGSQSPLREMKGQRVRRSSPQNNNEEFENSRKGEQSEHKSTESRGKKQEPYDKPAGRVRDITDLGQKDTKMTRKGLIDSLEVTPEEANAAKRSPRKDSVSRARDVTSYPIDATKSDEKIGSLSKDTGDASRPDALVNSRKKRRSPIVSSDSESELSENHKLEVTGKRKHKRSSKREAVSDDTSSESEVEDRKEAKRRKKEEKKSRKEERRRRRDERRRRREEKRASRRKQKSNDADVLSPDLKKHEKVDKASNGERVPAKYSSEEETESQKKKLEIELREKALESLRAKKGIRH